MSPAIRCSALGVLSVSVMGSEAVCPTVQAQTNAPCPPRYLFSCPVPKSDPMPKAITQPKTLTNPATGFELQSRFTDNAARYHWMNGRELLTVPVIHSEQGGVYGWVERKVLVPEVVRFKKVSVSGPLVAAIK